MSKLSRKRHTQPKALKVALKPEPDEDDDDFLPVPIVYQKVTEVSGPCESELKIKKDVEELDLNEIDSVYPPIKRETKLNQEKSKTTTSSNKNLKEVQINCEKELEVGVEETNDQVPESLKDRVVCPFCWKKLGDKLSGTTHVKTCGKDLPTERIFEALQLHEKQVREWEYLGIAYPGFQQAGTGKPANSKPPKATRRKKKDPELDLAIALSASLHEEIEDRKKKELEYLVEIGLEKEIPATVEDVKSVADHVQAISDAKAKFRVRFGKEAKIKLPKFLPPANNNVHDRTPIVKPRGGRGVRTKTKLTDTNLYKTTESERLDVVNQRVADILENSEKENGAMKERYRMNSATISEGMNERLNAYKDEKCSLWNLAASEDQPKEKFYTPAVIESKNRQIKNAPIVKPSAISSVNRKSTTEIEPSKISVKKPELNKTKPIQNINSSLVQTVRNVSNPVISRPSENFSLNDENPEIPQVAQDLLRLFVGKIGTDLTLYGLEEKPIRAHKLIITARCPKLLDEIIVESTNGKTREVIPLTCFTHAAVKSFVWFIYSGSLLPSEDKKVTEELLEMCQTYNMTMPETGESVIKSKPIRQSKSIINAPDCKYVEKSVQTDTPQKSPEPICVSTQLSPTSPTRSISSEKREIDLCESEEEVKVNEEVFNDSGDALLELCETRITHFEKNDSESEPEEESVSPVPQCSFDGIDRDLDPGNVSNDGSCDIFEEYFTEEAKDEESQLILKKRSRSLSPFSNKNSPTESQATKKHKFNLDDNEKCQEVEEEELLDIDKTFCKNPSLIILDDDDSSRSTGDGTDNVDFHISNSSFGFKDFEIEDDFSNPPIPEINSSPFDQSLPLPTTSFIPPVPSSPISRTTSFSRISVSLRSQSQRLSTIPETFSNINNKSRVSSDYTPRSSLFSPVLPVQTQIKNFPSSRIVQENNFHWDNDDSVLSKIPDVVLSIPTNPSCNDYPSPICIPKTKATREKQKFDDTEANMTTKEKGGRGRCKAKGKTSKTVSSNGQVGDIDPVTPSMSSSQPQSSNRTPLLNYSTIDTPILKGELKKYGLKPLPRSKAKVLLRHIYKETHK